MDIDHKKSGHARCIPGLIVLFFCALKQVKEIALTTDD